jgi:hypothetical protein
MGRNKKHAKRKTTAAGGTAPAAETSTSTSRAAGGRKETKIFVGLDFGITYLGSPYLSWQQH